MTKERLIITGLWNCRICSDLNFSDEMLALGFEKGLTTTIKKRLALGHQVPWMMFTESHGHAERIADILKEEKKEKEGKKEKGEKRKTSQGDEGSKKTYGGFGYGGSVGAVRGGGNSMFQACYSCGKYGHKARECRSTAKSSNGRGSYGNGNRDGGYYTPMSGYGSNQKSRGWSNQRSYDNRQGNIGDQSSGGKAFGTASTVQGNGEKGN
ncbi:uncharacterized protein LOC141612647 [Silene latifolia]|uniref:uncharacterized protein LOC141612647 n=1 Tax=Silene latifolia TaxID=37657 RepID=UPI003D77655E